MAQYELVLDDSSGNKLHVPVNGKGVVFGRAPESDVRIDHPKVSRYHVRLRAENDAVVLEYMGSRNGIRVNGKRTSSATLKHGDSFEVGGSLVTVTDLEKEASPAPEIPAEVLARHADNRLRMRRDPRTRLIFERACWLSIRTEDNKRLASEALDLIMTLTGARRSFLLDLNGDSGSIRVIASLSEDGYKGGGPHLNGTLVGDAVAHGAPTLKWDERPLPADATGERPAAICAPIKVAGRTLAAIYADSGWDDAEFDSPCLQDFRALVLIIGPCLAPLFSSVV